jgi:hypothetical protein
VFTGVVGLGDEAVGVRKACLGRHVHLVVVIMDHTDDSAVWCPICGEPAEDVQVSTEDGWSKAATHLVTVRACTNRYCEGYHHPAIWQRGVWSLVRITTG